MTTLDLDALQAAAEAATPQGEWKFSPWHIEEGEPAVRCDNYGLVCTTASDSTAAFIATFNPQTARALIDRLRKAEAANQWISVYEQLPEVGTTCLVFSQQSWEKEPSVKIDAWHEQHESPVSFSTLTIPTGPAWDEHNDFESVTHWMPLPAAPTSADSEGAKG